MYLAVLGCKRLLVVDDASDRCHHKVDINMRRVVEPHSNTPDHNSLGLSRQETRVGIMYIEIATRYTSGTIAQPRNP